jgi:hypothetical protein
LFSGLPNSRLIVVSTLCLQPLTASHCFESPGQGNTCPALCPSAFPIRLTVSCLRVLLTQKLVFFLQRIQPILPQNIIARRTLGHSGMVWRPEDGPIKSLLSRLTASRRLRHRSSSRAPHVRLRLPRPALRPRRLRRRQLRSWRLMLSDNYSNVEDYVTKFRTIEHLWEAPIPAPSHAILSGFLVFDMVKQPEYRCQDPMCQSNRNMKW